MDLDLPWAVKLGIRGIHYDWLWRSGADARAQNVLQVVQTRVPRHRPALLRARVLRCPSRPPPTRPAVWPRWKLTTPPCGKIVPRRMDPRRMVAQVARLLAEGPFVVNREEGDQEGGLGQRLGGGTEGHPTLECMALNSGESRSRALDRAQGWSVRTRSPGSLSPAPSVAGYGGRTWLDLSHWMVAASYPKLGFSAACQAVDHGTVCIAAR